MVPGKEECHDKNLVSTIQVKYIVQSTLLNAAVGTKTWVSLVFLELTESIGDLRPSATASLPSDNPVDAPPGGQTGVQVRPQRGVSPGPHSTSPSQETRHLEMVHKRS